MAETQTTDELQVSPKRLSNGHHQRLSPPARPLFSPPDNFDIESLVTEDDEPVDNIFSEKQQRLLTETLHASSEALPFPEPFVVLANVGLFYDPHRPPLVPDVLLSLEVQVADDLWEKQHRSYFTWHFGKLPEVVIEVVSNKKGGEDSSKLYTYAQIGIPYYVIFDPQQALSQEVLRVYQLNPQTQRYQQIVRAWFSGVGLGLKLWSGVYEGKEDVWLRWCDAAGGLVSTGKEATQAAQQQVEQESQRAELESQRAELESQRAELEYQRAELEYQRAELERQRVMQERQQKEQLIAQLKALGIEPQIGD